jgi:hypothetical protein
VSVVLQVEFGSLVALLLLLFFVVVFLSHFREYFRRGSFCHRYRLWKRFQKRFVVLFSENGTDFSVLQLAESHIDGVISIIHDRSSIRSSIAALVRPLFF